LAKNHPTETGLFARILWKLRSYKQMRNYRFHAVFLLAALIGALLSGCSAGAGTQGIDTPEEPLVILEWTGYEVTEYPQFFEPFSEKYGDQLNKVVSISVFGDDAEAFSKVQSGFDADIIHPCSSWWGLYVDAGLVQPIDTSRLASWDEIPEVLQKQGEFNGQQYFVPWDWYYEALLVRSDLVPEMPTSWADLWDPQYAGHVSLWDNGEVSFAAAAMAFGLDPWNLTAEEDEFLKQKLIEIKPNLLTYWLDYTQAIDLSASGDAWIVASAWQDTYSALADEGYDVTYVEPEEGYLAGVCGYGIGSESTNLDLAYEFLSAAIDKQSMANFSNEYWYGAANAAAAELIDPEAAELLRLNDLDFVLANTEFYQPLTAERRDKLSDMWNEIKAAP
jgi:spermidine/putrescine transport system substrate-binding protein